MKDTLENAALSKDRYKTRLTRLQNIDSFCSEIYCSVQSNSYRPLYAEELNSRVWSLPDLFYTASIPNSITKIIDHLSYDYTFKIYTPTGFNEEDDALSYQYVIGRFSIFKVHIKNKTIEPSFVLCVDNKVEDIRSTNFLTLETQFRGLVLLISTDFINNPNSKSLYNRLNKTLIKDLTKNDVNILQTSSEYIQKNVYNPHSFAFSSPIDKQKFDRDLVKSAKEEIEERMELPF